MPRLIHLNGPPGIGKSTLAGRYVDEHPGVLNLDIDLLRGMVGGWRERFTATGELVRPLALAMAATHLGAGRDVVLPQYLGRLSEIKRFEAVAHATGAAFVEVLVMDTREHSIERFSRRGASEQSSWHHYIGDVVAHAGGTASLAAMYDRLEEVRTARPEAVQIRSIEAAIGSTYEALIRALDTNA